MRYRLSGKKVPSMRVVRSPKNKVDSVGRAPQPTSHRAFDERLMNLGDKIQERHIEAFKRLADK